MEVSDRIFGYLEETIHHDYDKIHTGDLVNYHNLDGSCHLVVVLDKTDEGIIVVEGNYEGRIRWGRFISKDFLSERNLWVQTRWPQE